MLNVNLQDKDFRMIMRCGYYIEYDNDIITIRNGKGRLKGEIIYLKETNTIIILTRKRSVYCKKIVEVGIRAKRLGIYYVTKKDISLFIPLS